MPPRPRLPCVALSSSSALQKTRFRPWRTRRLKSMCLPRLVCGWYPSRPATPFSQHYKSSFRCKRRCESSREISRSFLARWRASMAGWLQTTCSIALDQTLQARWVAWTWAGAQPRLPTRSTSMPSFRMLWRCCGLLRCCRLTCFPREELSHRVALNFGKAQSEYRLYVATFLGYGANRALERYTTEMLRGLSEDQKVALDPCSPVGMKEKITGGSNGDVPIVGTGKFESCVNNLRALFQNSAAAAMSTDSKCQPHCGIDGIIQPPAREGMTWTFSGLRAATITSILRSMQACSAQKSGPSCSSPMRRASTPTPR
eukprot:m.39888 g.39888  ORF g.39888 m.39888 type:complete len:315 (-) comp5968_c0_seq3:410-1354(-)